MQNAIARRILLMGLAGVFSIGLALPIFPDPPHAFALSNPCALDPNNIFANGTLAPGHSTPYGLVADGWESFVFTGMPPQFNVVDNEKIDPHWSQQVFSANTFDAGIQQTVWNLQPGVNYWYRLGYSLAAKSYNGPNVRVNTIGRKIGVDPTGGNDPQSPNVIWGPDLFDGNVAVNRPEMTMVFTARSDHATIFLRAMATDGSSGENRVWFDAVCGEARPDLPPSTPLAGTTTATPTTTTCLPTIRATISVGAHPKAITIDPATHRVFVGLFDSSAVAVIDTTTNQRTAGWLTDGLGNANGLTFANGRVYMTKRNNANVSLIDASTGNFLGNVNVGNLPFGASAANNRVWIANFADGTVSVIDTISSQTIAKTMVGQYPALVATMNDQAYVSVMAGGVAIVGADGSLRGKITALGTGMFGIATNSATRRVYAASRDKNTISVIDADTNAVVQSVTEPFTPYAVAVNPNTNHLFEILADVNRARVRDATTLALIADLPIGIQGEGGGDGIAVVDNQVYVSNNGAGTVSVISDSCDVTPMPTPTATRTATPVVINTATSTPTAPPIFTPTPTRTATITPSATLIPPTRTATVTPPATVIPPTRTATTTPPITLIPPTRTNTPFAGCAPSVINQISVGTHPKGIAGDPIAKRIFVGLFDSSSIAVIAADTNQKIATWSTNNTGHTNGVAVTNGRVFATMRDSASVSILDASSGAWIANRAVGALPYGVGAANGRVWVANFLSRSVSVIDAATTNVLATAQIGDYPALVATTNDVAFVAYGGGGVASVARNGAIVKNLVALGPGSYAVAVDVANNRLFVSNRDSNQISVVDTIKSVVIQRVTLPATPYALAFNPDTNRLFIILPDLAQVDVRDAATLSRIALLSVGPQGDNGGDGITVMSGRVYIANNAAGTVTVIQDNCPR
ncbi:MAG: YncE family protein [Chloroflexi bacterium]|nr:YncE family protein [Chloroflexota bacterium]